MREEDARSPVFVMTRLKVRKIGNAGCQRNFLPPRMRHVDKECARWQMKLPERRDGRDVPNASSMGQVVHLHSF